MENPGKIHKFEKELYISLWGKDSKEWKGDAQIRRYVREARKAIASVLGESAAEHILRHHYGTGYSLELPASQLVVE